MVLSVILSPFSIAPAPTPPAVHVRGAVPGLRQLRGHVYVFLAPLHPSFHPPL